MTEQKKFLPDFKVYSPSLDKKWFIYYYDKAGKRIRKYGDINRHDSRKDRMMAAKKLIRELKTTVELSQPTAKTLIYNYIEENRLKWRKKTYQGYKSKLDVFFGWLGRRRLTYESVREFFQHLEQTRHPTTQNQYREKLRRLFKSVDMGHLFEQIEPIRERRTPARYFQPHQRRRLKAYIQSHDPGLWLFIQFVYYCFIRPGNELCNLKAGDILLEEKRIRVVGEYSKNHKTQYVAIPYAFRPKLDFVEKMRPKEYIFPSPFDQSKPIHLNTMTRRHRLILDKLGFGPEYKLYSWKHTGAVEIAKTGVGLKKLQIQLRHHSLDQVDEYLRQMGVQDLEDLSRSFPKI